MVQRALGKGVFVEGFGQIEKGFASVCNGSNPEGRFGWKADITD